MRVILAARGIVLRAIARGIEQGTCGGGGMMSGVVYVSFVFLSLFWIITTHLMNCIAGRESLGCERMIGLGTVYILECLSASATFARSP